jgi:hypothetical protein
VVYGYITNQNGLAWRGNVRALVNNKWQDWSKTGKFDVEPLNTDCGNLHLHNGWDGRSDDKDINLGSRHVHSSATLNDNGMRTAKGTPYQFNGN